MTVTFREDTGKWQAVLNNKELFGKKRPAKSFRNKKDAEKWERDEIRAAEEGRKRGNSRKLLSDVAEEFIENTWKRTTGRNPDLDALGTATDYARLVKTHICPALGNIPITKVDTSDAQVFLDDFKSRYSPGHSRVAYGVVRGILDFAVDRGYRAFNPLRDRPCKNVPTPRVRGETEIPTFDEIHKLFLFIEGPRPFNMAADRWDNWKALFPTMALAGLRVGEIRGLQIPDLDFANRKINIRRQQSKGRRIKPPKGRTGAGAAFRSVPMDPIVYRALLDHVERLGRDTGHVFVPVGKDPNRGSCDVWCWLQMKRLQILVGIVDETGKEKYCPHSLRHFAGSAWLNRGVEIQFVAWWLGHADVKTTYRIYAKQLQGRGNQGLMQLETTTQLFPGVRALPAPSCNENATE